MRQEVSNVRAPPPKREPLTAPSALNWHLFRASGLAAMSVSHRLALLCLISTVRAQPFVIVVVDPIAGNDSSCLSAQEASQEALNGTVSSTALDACASINRALGEVGCGRSASCLNSGEDQLNGVEIRLADGVHRLTGESSRHSVVCAQSCLSFSVATCGCVYFNIDISTNFK